MKGKKTGGRNWSPGQSGNAGGRPRSGETLKEILDRELNKKKNGKTKKQIIIETLINMAVAGDYRAIDRVISWDESRYQFDRRVDLEDRILEIEEILHDEKN
jgi:hypothetical protein